MIGTRFASTLSENLFNWQVYCACHGLRFRKSYQRDDDRVLHLQVSNAKPVRCQWASWLWELYHQLTGAVTKHIPLPVEDSVKEHSRQWLLSQLLLQRKLSMCRLKGRRVHSALHSSDWVSPLAHSFTLGPWVGPWLAFHCFRPTAFSSSRSWRTCWRPSSSPVS